MRQTYQLNEQEWPRFRRLQPYQGAALAFWSKVARDRGCDPKTVISNGGTFTALPAGHGKHWCFPIPLKCQKKPFYKE